MAPPKKPVQLKVVAGTARADRDFQPETQAVELELVLDVPEAPDWLPNKHAEAEWHRLTRILHSNRLLTEASLSPLAMLCALHGKLVQLWMAGETPTGHMLAQYRALVGEFGLTPVAQGKVKGSAPVAQTGNKFKTNGKRRSA
ncbi:hypothetical protein [Achromobacter denitrificans]|uniref:hypothetical protein n=1 Tax=Achromobacter denitrificans TaxID=32002 RepID=UPI000F65DCE2|nr:hypothetical protein [Achromobacter denitrificans]RSE84350.1 hypothetical protein EGU64_14910 [Achromobacter denitrificans]